MLVHNAQSHIYESAQIPLWLESEQFYWTTSVALKQLQDFLPMQQVQFRAALSALFSQRSSAYSNVNAEHNLCHYVPTIHQWEMSPYTFGRYKVFVERTSIW